MESGQGHIGAEISNRRASGGGSECRRRREKLLQKPRSRRRSAVATRLSPNPAGDHKQQVLHRAQSFPRVSDCHHDSLLGTSLSDHCSGQNLVRAACRIFAVSRRLAYQC